MEGAAVGVGDTERLIGSYRPACLAAVSDPGRNGPKLPLALPRPFRYSGMRETGAQHGWRCTASGQQSQPLEEDEVSIFDDLTVLVRNQLKATICVWSRASNAPVQVLGVGECFVLLSPEGWRKLNAELHDRGLLAQPTIEGRQPSVCGAPVVDLDKPEGEETLQVVRNVLRKRAWTGW